MKKRIITAYFPVGLKYCAPLLFAGALLLVGHPVWAVMLVLTGVIILTTHYGTEIDLTSRTYQDYLSFLWMKFNPETGKFNQVEKIVITKGNYAQNIQTRVQSRTMAWSDYTGTLIFAEDHRLDLLTDTDKKELIKKLKEFAVFLSIKVEDHTSSEPYWINLDKY